VTMYLLDLFFFSWFTASGTDSGAWD
jgi:hypothetical protein